MVAKLSQTNTLTKDNQSLTCRLCGQTQVVPDIPYGWKATCARCHANLIQHTPRGIQRTMAYSLSALILFIPANTLPIVSMNRFGFQSESTIWQGVVDLWKSGTPGVAVLVLFCSIVIPLLKIIGLFYLCVSWKRQTSKYNSTLFQLIELIGRWSMLDVFLVAILVAVVKLGTFASVHSEPGLIAFAAVVVLTMIASANFDARMLWRPETP